MSAWFSGSLSIARASEVTQANCLFCKVHLHNRQNIIAKYWTDVTTVFWHDTLGTLCCVAAQLEHIVFCCFIEVHMEDCAATDHPKHWYYQYQAQPGPVLDNYRL